MPESQLLQYLRKSPPCKSCRCCPALFQVDVDGDVAHCYTCLLAHGVTPRPMEVIEDEMDIARKDPDSAKRLLALYRELNATKFLDDVGKLPPFMLCQRRGMVAA